MRTDNYGFTQIYFGNGKGKTTAAIGQAVRAAGNGFQVSFMQFLKNSDESGEAKVLCKIPNIFFKSYGNGKFLTVNTVTVEDINSAKQCIESIFSMISNKYCDLLVMDEIGAALELGIVSEKDTLSIINNTKGWMDIILTGRVFNENILEKADLITRMEMLKHPFEKGFSARKGIEF